MAETGKSRGCSTRVNFVRVFCSRSLTDDPTHTIVAAQTFFDDHMVVRVSRNSCFITEAFDTTVTATLSIKIQAERDTTLSYWLDERTPPISWRFILFFPFVRLPTILDVKIFTGSVKVFMRNDFFFSVITVFFPLLSSFLSFSPFASLTQRAISFLFFPFSLL